MRVANPPVANPKLVRAVCYVARCVFVLVLKISPLEVCCRPLAACLSRNRGTDCKIINKKGKKRRKEIRCAKLLTCKFHDSCVSKLLVPPAPPSAIIHHAATNRARGREQLLGTVCVCVCIRGVFFFFFGAPKKLLYLH